MSAPVGAGLREQIVERLAELDPAMRYDSPLLTRRAPLADRAADAALVVVREQAEKVASELEAEARQREAEAEALRDGTWSHLAATKSGIAAASRSAARRVRSAFTTDPEVTK